MVNILRTGEQAGWWRHQKMAGYHQKEMKTRETLQKAWRR
jgi:hypothetical protein